MERTADLDEILEMADALPLLDKVRLIERLAPRIAREMECAPDASRKSLRGLWKGVDVSVEDLDVARREMWGSFPAPDVCCRDL